MVASISFKVLADELLTTTALVQENIEALIKEPENSRYIVVAVDNLNQVRGSFSLLEDRGSELLCLCLIEVLEAQIILPASERIKSNTIDRISQGVLLVNRYIEFRKLQSNPYPELLTTAINLVQAGNNKPLYPESYFWDKDITPLKNTLQLTDKALNPKLQTIFRHTLALYHKALLQILKGKNKQPAFLYLAKLSEKARGFLNGYKAQETWLLAQGLFEAFSQHETELTPERKRVFSMLERSLRMIVTQGENAANQTLGKAAIKEMLYLTALLSDGHGFSAQVLKRYKVDIFADREQKIIETRAILTGPGVSVMESLAHAVKDELAKIKDTVNSIEKNNSQGWGNTVELLQQCAQSLKLVGLVSPANVLNNLITQISDTEVNNSTLTSLAESVIYVESSLGRFHSTSNNHTIADSAAKEVLHEARIVLLSEAEQGINCIKRSITSFMESAGDSIHLSKCHEYINELNAAMTFLDSPLGVELIEHLRSFVLTKLATENTKISADLFEIFADGLSSIEFFLEENLTHPNELEQESLDSAKAAFQALGYTFNA